MCERRQRTRDRGEITSAAREEDMEFSVFASSLAVSRPTLLLMGCAAGSPTLIHLKAFLEINKGAGSEETEPRDGRWASESRTKRNMDEEQIFSCVDE